MSESWLNLEGKTVIVTGGASGIGKAVAQGFLNAGSNVVISDMAPEAPEMDEAAGKLLYVKTDVTKVADVEAMVEKAKETFGTIDVLVNNAGINIPRLLVDPKDPKGQYELDEAVWDKVCNVNLRSNKERCKLFDKILGKRTWKTGSQSCRSSTWNHGSYRTSYNCL